MLIFLDHILGGEPPRLPVSFCPDSHLSCFVVRAERDLLVHGVLHSVCVQQGFFAVFYMCLKHFSKHIMFVNLR